MHYAVLTQNAEVEVAVDEVRLGCFAVTIDGHTLDIEAQELAEGQLRVSFGGTTFVVELDGDNAWVGDHCLRGEVIELRALALRRARKAAQEESGVALVTAPMAGKVAAILVAEGQQVVQGQGLLVIEAMKMENELRAPKAGTVTSLCTQLGSVVELGATLCRVE